VRKGPWTEQEDVQLVFYVNLFGDRRWDFVAKVSGLKVAGDRYAWYDCFGHDMAFCFEPFRLTLVLHVFVFQILRFEKNR